jgi:DNA-binding transcriptional MerR regulator
MTSKEQFLTIQEAAQTTGLTVHTLRFYERIGLLVAVERASNGHRRYAQRDLERMQVIYRLRQTGMPLDQIKRFTDAFDAGEEGIPTRIELLEAQRTSVLAQIDTLNQMLGWIDYKLGLYRKTEEEKKAR